MVHVYIRIKGRFDTLALWKRIKHIEKINLTSLGEITWIHGDIALSNLGEVVGSCCAYGELEIAVHRLDG